MARGSDGRFDGVAALIDPVGAIEAHHAAGACHKLPQAHRAGARVGPGVEAALDHRQVEQIERDTLAAQDRDDHIAEAARAPEPGGEGLAAPRLEEVDTSGDAGVGVDGYVAAAAELVDAHQWCGVGGQVFDFFF